MFNSNVQPSKRKNAGHPTWVCPNCKEEKPGYWLNCATCFVKRP